MRKRSDWVENNQGKRIDMQIVRKDVRPKRKTSKSNVRHCAAEDRRAGRPGGEEIQIVKGKGGVQQRFSDGDENKNPFSRNFLRRLSTSSSMPEAQEKGRCTTG